MKLEGRRIVVIGGGSVGHRKIGIALAGGAIVRVIEPLALCPEPLHSSLEWIAESYRPEHLHGMSIAFATATAEVNARVTADARTRGIWVCNATDPASGDFTLPATGRCGAVTLSVDTGGAAPALARRLRDRWLAECDTTLETWVQLLAEIRPHVLTSIPDLAVRTQLLNELADWPWLDRLRREGTESTRDAMREAVHAAVALCESTASRSS